MGHPVEWGNQLLNPVHLGNRVSNRSGPGQRWRFPPKLRLDGAPSGVGEPAFEPSAFGEPGFEPFRAGAAMGGSHPSCAWMGHPVEWGSQLLNPVHLGNRVSNRSGPGQRWRFPPKLRLDGAPSGVGEPAFEPSAFGEPAFEPSAFGEPAFEPFRLGERSR